jgi:predicted lipid-binding transport protein (Tim44 family)
MNGSIFLCCLVLSGCVGFLLLSACNSPKIISVKHSQLTSPPDGETTSPLANTATSPIPAALDKAQSIPVQTAQTAQSASSAAQSTSSQVANTVQPASAQLKGTLALQTSLQGMLAGISATRTAVKSGDLTTAQQEFSMVQGDWAKVGEVVKT